MKTAVSKSTSVLPSISSTTLRHREPYDAQQTEGVPSHAAEPAPTASAGLQGGFQEVQPSTFAAPQRTATEPIAVQQPMPHEATCQQLQPAESFPMREQRVSSPRTWSAHEVREYAVRMKNFYQQRSRMPRHMSLHLRLPHGDPSDMGPGGLQYAIANITAKLPEGWEVVSASVRRGSLLMELQLEYRPACAGPGASTMSPRHLPSSPHQQGRCMHGFNARPPCSSGHATEVLGEAQGLPLVALLLSGMPIHQLLFHMGVQDPRLALGAELKLEVDGVLVHATASGEQEGWDVQLVKDELGREAVLPAAPAHHQSLSWTRCGLGADPVTLTGVMKVAAA
eukprot:CAMPEP_0202898974 /NCGR_PEP_ID=MMETSP1392-20130828/7346_1 /ASSEMBLY_ACC=CAM_ASM_000868 /TAXON_ID=225041 /ORGANISM="Chlamydomonas chlamydogama, Strain SAG 11-48b" /LENGTH=338 /DNA_ID=CAMNT_0049585049 /DNA_START=490 /DNA_END=1506 /DNA_ORIENTATION=-